MSLLEVADLRVTIATGAGAVQAVRGVDFSVAAGETLALVGESGCGKSVTALSILGLAPAASRVRGSVRWRGRELLEMDRVALRRLRGVELALVGQNPMAALNPTQRVGDQIAEMLIVHCGWTRRRALARAVELLAEMQLSDPGRQARQYPFEFSGGMLQRAAIAMAVACEPRLLIADEPTTALDVTVQAQVLSLMARLCEQRGMALLLITHDLGVVAQMADRVAVMYAGEIIESAPVGALFQREAHPYSSGLKRALPERVLRGEPLVSIAGSPPDLLAPPDGCGFCQRCPRAMEICRHGEVPAFALDDSHWSRCWLRHPDCPAEYSDAVLGRHGGGQ